MLTLFFLIGSILMFFIIRLLKLYFKIISFGILIITLWSSIINFFYFADFFKIDTILTLVVFGGICLLFIYFTLKNKQVKVISIIKDEDGKYLLKLYLVWYIGLFIFLIPLILFLPKDTLIPQAAVSTDSVVHSLLSMGKSANESTELNSYWSLEYPRGYHSFIYFINSILKLDVRGLLTPFVALGFSFIIFFIDAVTTGVSSIKGVKKALLMLLPMTSFFIISVGYALFVPQIVVIPILLTCVWGIFELKNNKLKYFILWMLTLAIINIYGLYAVNVVGVALGVSFLLELFRNRGKIRNRLKKTSLAILNVQRRLSKFTLGIIISMTIFSIPTIILLYNNTLSSFIHTDVTFTGTGNLGNTFLSPFHLTGFWLPDEEYRSLPDSYQLYYLLGIFVLQLFFIFKARNSTALIKTNFVFLLMVVASLIIFKNQYIHFKYLSYFIPLFLITFGISFIEYFKNEKLPIVNVILFIIILAAIILPYSSYKAFPAATRKNFEPFEYIKTNYIDKTSTLVLSSDAWMQYYLKDSQDDYAPLNNYAFPRLQFKNQQIDVIVTDSLYGSDTLISEYLEKYPGIKSSLSEIRSKCIIQYERFTIYKLTCNENQ